MARLTVLNYAVDGIDVAQAQRLIAVTRWLQRYAVVNGDSIEPYFIASTEAENVLFAERMAAFRLPSRAAAQNAELEPTRYMALAKQWVWHSIGLLQPDVLIVDTWPRGAFGELLNAFDLCRKRIFIYSPDSQTIAEAPDFQAMLPLYDLILVPEAEGACSLPFGTTDPAKIRWLGPILTREKVELLDRWEARERLGAHSDSFLLYVSVGNGADAESQELLHTICAAVMDEQDIHIVIGGATLFFGSLLQGPRITWLNGPSLDVAPAFDAALCAASYTAYHELTAAGVPTAWLPRRSLGDDQTARAQRSADGLDPIILEPDDLRGSEIMSALQKLRERRRQRPHQDGGSADFRNFARDAAQAVLSTVWPDADVQRAAEAIDDRALRAAADMSLPAHALVTFARWISGDAKPGRTATQAACELFNALFAHALYPPLGQEIVRPLCEALPKGTAADRAGAVVTLLDALACFEDWSAARIFLASLETETSASLADFRNALIQLLDTGASHGLALQDIAECLQAARAHEPSLDQYEAVARLTGRLAETAPLKLRAV